MFIATVILTVLFALAAAGSGVMKFKKPDDMVANMAAVGVKREQMNILGALELAGALGLIVGLFWAPIGIAAAIGLVLYFVGAVVAHVRAGDKNLAPAAVLALVAVVVLVLRLLSL